MSATTERLLEEIQTVKQNIETNTRTGNKVEVQRLVEILEELNIRLIQANSALNENVTLLKG